ncbi:Cytochrome P450 4d2 [Boothiomyces macroporosus]|uniref:Cytochrome P450 4d2 n=1 Tax=Boothiomyces macroporosus TaxID=261099 RepID=A0AAD5UAE7_9FUNG|nr:Cytochrome P450 4d2 [Boothiomyces macroporosus]
METHKLEILAGIGIAIAAYQLFRKQDAIPSVGVFGNLEAIYLTLTKRRKEFYEKYHSKLGPIFRYGIFGSDVAIGDADEIKRIFTTTDDFGKEALKDIATGYLDGSLLGLDTGNDHRMHRALVQPAFGPTHLKHTAVATMEIVDQLADFWYSKVSDKPLEIDAFDAMNSVVVQVLISVLFGGNVNLVGKTEQEKTSMWGSVEKSIVPIFTLRMVVPMVLWRTFGIARYSPKVVEMRNKLEESMMKMVENNDPNREVDRLSSALDSQKLSQDQILTEMIGFFIAGQDTTANTLTFMLYELGLHPDIQQKLYNEIKDFELKDESDALRYINEFKYLDSVFKETMRMHPLVPAIDRLVVKDTFVLGYPVRKGQTVYCSNTFVFKSEKYYKNPESFNPERWLADDSNPNAYQPFDGPRNCIGQKMAVIEAKYAIVQILKRFSVQNVEQKIHYKSMIVSTIKGAKVGILPRELA